MEKMSDYMKISTEDELTRKYEKAWKIATAYLVSLIRNPPELR